MKVDGVDPAIHFIERGWRNANSVLLLGDDAVLIDTGHIGYAAQTAQLLRQEGLDFGDLSLIVNTHSHWDHTGGNHHLQQLSGAPLAMGPLTADWMRNERRREMWLSYFGVTAELTQADQIIAPGEICRWAGADWQVLALPGHAPDGLGFYQADAKLLICADALMAGGDCGVINVMVHGWEALDAAQQTARRLAALDVRIALPGHGPPIGRYQQAVARLQRRLANFRREPRWLVTHFARRIVMATILELEPVAPAALLAHLQRVTWSDEYAALVGCSAEALLHETLQALVDTQALRRQNGYLISQITK